MSITPFGWDRQRDRIGRVIAGLDDKVELALDSAANVFVDAAKSMAPHSAETTRGDNYRSSIKVLASGPGYRIVGSDKNVMAKKNGIVYNIGMILEYGSIAHDIEPILASVLFWIAGGVVVWAMIVHHPGTRPQPHFHPAMQEMREKFPNIFLKITMVLWD